MYVEPASSASSRGSQGLGNKRPLPESSHKVTGSEQEPKNKRANIGVQPLSSSGNDADIFQQHSNQGAHKIPPIALRLRECIENRSLDGVRSCIQEGVRLDQLISPEGMLPLNAAITMNSETGVSMAKLIISQDPSCVNFSCEDSVSPLFAAYTTKNISLVKFLLSHGADPFFSCTECSPSLFDFIEGISEFNEPPRHAQETLEIIENWKATNDGGLRHG